MTKTELLALAEQIDAIGWCSADEAKPLNAMSALARKLAALEPVAWSTTRTKDGKKTLEFGACLPTNPAYTKAHNEWDWTGLYNLTGIIDHE